MPTHIFLALGMWDEVVSQNELASGRDRAIWAPNHYTQWLGYGYLQQGRYDTAQRHLELMRRNAEKGLRERAGAGRALADLATLNGNRAPPAPRHERDEVPDIVQLELQALLRQAGGATDEAVRLMREAAVLEDRMPAEFGPPPDVKPAHELFGELLLEAGRAAEAQREFARALALAPKRALSLLGLGRAAAAAGDRATAAQAYREVREIWHRADPGLPGLAEASRSVGAP